MPPRADWRLLPPHSCLSDDQQLRELTAGMLLDGHHRGAGGLEAERSIPRCRSLQRRDGMGDPRQQQKLPHNGAATLQTTSRSTRHGEVTIAYERQSVAGDPLLLIAGIGADMHFWRDEFCNELVDKGFQVARSDNRDVGDSSRIASGGTPKWRQTRDNPSDAPYALEDMADDAAAVMDALGWRSANVVGQSLGGMIAQMLAIRYPDRVRSLTSISSTPEPGLSRLRLVTALRLLRMNPKDFFGKPPRTAEEAGDRLVRGHRITGSPNFALDETWLREVAAASFERGPEPAAWARQESAAWGSGDLRPRLSELRVPTLVLHGSSDVLVRPSGGMATAAAVPNSRLVMIGGMGHDLPRDLWPMFANMIRATADAATVP
jgi:pimeloyl-ACP methyl ester carboxylesterase